MHARIEWSKLSIGAAMHLCTAYKTMRNNVVVIPKVCASHHKVDETTKRVLAHHGGVHKPTLAKLCSNNVQNIRLRPSSAGLI